MTITTLEDNASSSGKKKNRHVMSCQRVDLNGLIEVLSSGKIKGKECCFRMCLEHQNDKSMDYRNQCFML